MTAVTERTEHRPVESRDPVAAAGGLPAPGDDLSRGERVHDLEEAHERSAFTGLDPEDLVAFRPERLVVHELLIRVMGDVSVPDGREYADLGVNFRKITETIHRSHIDPHMADIVRAYHELRRRAAGLIESELSSSLFAAATDRAREPARGGVLGLLGLGRKRQGPPPESIEDKERRILAEWQQRAAASDEPLLTCTLRSPGQARRRHRHPARSDPR